MKCRYVKAFRPSKHKIYVIYFFVFVANKFRHLSPKIVKLPLKFCVVYYINITTDRACFREVVHINHTSENVGTEPRIVLIKLN